MKKWALLVAGSKGWDNYRHQADVCHAYQVLHHNGIPDEQIVVMMYDDIANHENNLYQGEIFNRPDHHDVYTGVPKDYVGEDITPNNFLNILKGNKSAMTGIGSEKVIESGPDDNVFVYFSDHGAYGLIFFPNDDMLYADQLNAALTSMNKEKKYGKLVFYLESCYSGSMFAETDLPANIYATTAANANENSYACYPDYRQNMWLGDLYSVNWIEDSFTSNLCQKSLNEQFEIVKQKTSISSHVKRFGDMTMGDCKVEDFQGHKTAQSRYVFDHPGVIPSHEVPMVILYRKLQEARSPEESQKIQQEIADLKQLNIDIHKAIKMIVTEAIKSEEDPNRIMKAETKKITNWDRYRQVVTKFDKQGYALGQHDYARTLMGVLANLCEESIETSIILDAITIVFKKTSKVSTGSE